MNERKPRASNSLHHDVSPTDTNAAFPKTIMAYSVDLHTAKARTTYQVPLPCRIRDLHNNQAEKPFNIVLSHRSLIYSHHFNSAGSKHIH